MSVVALEGIVDHGLIRLPPSVKLPNKTKVYILVPAIGTQQETRIASPRLVHPEQAREFVMEVSEDLNDASL